MSATLVTGIAELVTNDPSVGSGLLGILHDAALVDEGGRVAWVGPATRAPACDRALDVAGRAVFPGFVDSHTHLVFEGQRSDEFAARMAGEPYTGGGIDRTVAATRGATDERLRSSLAARMRELRAQGTTTVEIKSGYGLGVAQEARLLRLAGEVTTETTYLGGHVIAPEYRDRRGDYIDLVTGAMLDACAPHAKWIDAFCEPGSPTALDEEEAREVLRAGAARGLRPRVHGAQLAEGPGPRLAVEVGAASLDHATHLSEADVDLLALAAPEDGPVVTLLPLVEFSTRQPFPDARRLLERGVTVALASDCNPGTNASSSMAVAMGIAVRDMGMTPPEALWAATAGGAAALRRRDVGRLAPGCRADLAVVDAPSHLHLTYRFGVPLVRGLDPGTCPDATLRADVDLNRRPEW
ncbi:MAG: imidazolonepropionase [Propionibacterium sp.]|nr:imidazolonepropionase [Propionibacterium sp.]